MWAEKIIKEMLPTFVHSELKLLMTPVVTNNLGGNSGSDKFYQHISESLSNFSDRADFQLEIPLTQDDLVLVSKSYKLNDDNGRTIHNKKMPKL